MHRTLSLVVLAALPILMICCGCAVLNDANRPTLNMVEDALAPKSGEPTFTDWLIIVPPGLLAVAADTIAVHPAMRLDDAWQETCDIAWRGLEWDDHYVSECALWPLRVIVTPIYYVPIWLKHAFFDVPPYGAEEPVAATVEDTTGGE